MSFLKMWNRNLIKQIIYSHTSQKIGANLLDIVFDTITSSEFTDYDMFSQDLSASTTKDEHRNTRHIILNHFVNIFSYGNKN